MATDDNLEPRIVRQALAPPPAKRFVEEKKREKEEGGRPHGTSTAAFTSGETENIYRGPDMFYILSSEGNRGVFVTQLFQQSDDVHTPAMLK